MHRDYIWDRSDDQEPEIFPKPSIFQRDPVYELYRKLDALHLYSGDKAPTRSVRVPGGVKRVGRQGLYGRKMPCHNPMFQNPKAGCGIPNKVREMNCKTGSKSTLFENATTTSTRKPSSFLILPPEIRCQIYNYLLVVGKLFPYHTAEAKENNAWENKEAKEHTRPTVSIVQVCKLIQTESEPILYSRNTIVLPSLRWTQRLLKHCLHNESRCSYIRSVVLPLSCKDAYLSKDIAGNPQLNDRLIDHRLKIKKKQENWISTAVHQQMRRHLVLLGRETTLLSKISHIAWPDKANLVLDRFHLHDLTVQLQFAGPVQPGTLVMGFEPEGDAIRAFRAGFAFGVPHRLIFENFDNLETPKTLERARRRISRWTSYREMLTWTEDTYQSCGMRVRSNHSSEEWESDDDNHEDDNYE